MNHIETIGAFILKQPARRDRSYSWCVLETTIVMTVFLVKRQKYSFFISFIKLIHFCLLESDTLTLTRLEAEGLGIHFYNEVTNII